MNSSFAGLAAVAWRESRTASRRLLLYMSSIVFGVAAVVAIDSFADNATRTVQEQARALLGGDLALLSRDAFPAPAMQLFDSLSRAGTGVARQTTFATMAVAADTTAMRLVQFTPAILPAVAVSAGMTAVAGDRRPDGPRGLRDESDGGAPGGLSWGGLSGARSAPAVGDSPTSDGE
jgi:hypothetical protein